MKVIINLFFFILLFSCSKGAKSPEGLIKMFVQDVSTKKVDKAYFEEFTTGELWDAVKDLNEEEFAKYQTAIKKVNKVRLKIINKKCTQNTCMLTYEVGYLHAQNEKEKYASEVKKIANVVKDGDVWKIAKVSNIKTYIEAQDTIEVGP